MPSNSMNHTFSSPINATEMKSVVFTAAGVLVVTLTIAVTLIGDCLIFTAFYSNTSIHTRANLFFLSLITADILQALFVMPLELVRVIHEPLWPIGDSTTKLWNSMFVCFGTASACNLAAIGVERYLTIARPLIHHCATISRRTLAGICFVWIYAISSGLYSFFVWETTDHIEPGFSISVSHAIPLLVLDSLTPLNVCVVSYTGPLIYRISVDHSCRISLLCGWTIDGQKIRIAKERKPAKTLSLLVGVFMACSLPFWGFFTLWTLHSRNSSLTVDMQATW